MKMNVYVWNGSGLYTTLAYPNGTIARVPADYADYDAVYREFPNYDWYVSLPVDLSPFDAGIPYSRRVIKRGANRILYAPLEGPILRWIGSRGACPDGLARVAEGLRASPDPCEAINYVMDPDILWIAYDIEDLMRPINPTLSLQISEASSEADTEVIRHLIVTNMPAILAAVEAQNA